MSRASRIRTAQANVKLRFGSEDDALTAAIRQAYENRHASSSAARTQSQGVINAVRETIPAAKRIYRDQAAQQQTAADVYGRDVAGLGGVAASIQAGAALERQNATDQLAQSRSGTLTGLTQQSVAAKSGRQFALQQARSQFVKDIHDVLSQKRSLSEKEGAFLTSELARLTQAQADRALKRGTLNETIRHDKVGETTAQQKADQTGKGKKYDATHSDYDQAAAQIGKALAAAKLLDPDRNPADRVHIADLLANGSKAQPIYKTVTTTDSNGKKTTKQVRVLNADGTPRMTPGIPQVDPRWITVALDQWYLRGLSKTTRRKVHQAGYKVHRLPVNPHMRPQRKPVSGSVGVQVNGRPVTGNFG